jgi:hypothetical protein
MKFNKQMTRITTNGESLLIQSSLSDKRKPITLDAFKAMREEFTTDGDYLILDIETFPNFFQVGIKSTITKTYISFDISNGERFDDNLFDAMDFILKDKTIITYNGLNYDNPMLAYVYGGTRSTRSCVEFTRLIIEGIDFDYKGTWNRIISTNAINSIYQQFDTFSKEECRNIAIAYSNNNGHKPSSYQMLKAMECKAYKYPSIDLMKLIPNASKLKLYGGTMFMNIRELPYDIRANLSEPQINNLITYNENDLDITLALYEKLKTAIKLRETLNIKFNIDNSNPYNDFRNKGDAGLGLSLLQQRMSIKASKVTSDYKFKISIPSFVKFENPILQKKVEQIRNHIWSLSSTKSINKPAWLTKPFKLADNKFALGIGGLHSKEKALSVVASHYGSKAKLRNIDVTSYYPWLIFIYELAPSHVDTAQYIQILIDVFKDRVIAKQTEKKYKKIIRQRDLTPVELDDLADAKLINATNKLILNGGGFGKVGDKYSDSFDPKIMANITILGQLFLLMLIEQLDKIEGVTILSSNTDGIELLDVHGKLDDIKTKVVSWEIMTGLNMEYGEYLELHAEAVNNYYALYDGYGKGKGDYENHTYTRSLTYPIVYEAIRQFIHNKTPMETTINASTDIKQFLSTAKVDGGAVAYYSNIKYNKAIPKIDNDGLRVYGVIAKSKRIKINGVDVKDYCGDNLELRKKYFNDIYDLTKPKTTYIKINKSTYTHDGKDIGSIVRFYYTNKDATTIIRRNTASKVSEASGVALLNDINTFDKVKHPIDYERYIRLAYTKLKKLGIN